MNTILIQQGLLKQFAKILPKDLRDHRFVIITDNRVKKLYGNLLLESLWEYEVDLISFPEGERSKTRETKAKLESALLKKKFGRDTCIIALGGGVVGDMAGFVAATYMRGIPYIQVPTTLLAMVDSSVGGKTAVNTPEGKNLIGAFHPPRLVVADLDCLATLPPKQTINGWVEALKIFMISDADLFKRAVKAGGPSRVLIRKAVALKAQIVAQDPKEQNLRAILNFGHTLGHALETVSDYQLLHGYAVAYGLLIEARISLNRGLIDANAYDLISTAFRDLGINPQALLKYSFSKVLKATRQDKKSKNKACRMVLLNGLGKVYQHKQQFTHLVEDAEIITALHEVCHGR
jgi:3-dehydroquinate synthase